MLDYARTYGLPAIVFRMSCIYGPHQFGTEDQGWVAHFLIRAMEGEPIMLYGDGRQVRDILCVDDLVDAFLLAQQSMATESANAFNIGGGPGNTVSLLELLEMIGELLGHKPEVEFDSWRPGDQRYYVSDTAKFQRTTGWRPRISVQEGLERLTRWLSEMRVSPSARLAHSVEAEEDRRCQAVARPPRARRLPPGPCGPRWWPARDGSRSSTWLSPSQAPARSGSGSKAAAYAGLTWLSGKADPGFSIPARPARRDMKAGESSTRLVRASSS